VWGAYGPLPGNNQGISVDGSSQGHDKAEAEAAAAAFASAA
jgi:hypothetical protein